MQGPARKRRPPHGGSARARIPGCIPTAPCGFPATRAGRRWWLRESHGWDLAPKQAERAVSLFSWTTPRREQSSKNPTAPVMRFRPSKPSGTKTPRSFCWDLQVLLNIMRGARPLLPLSAHLPVSVEHVFVRNQRFQPHWAARVQLLRGNANLRAEAKHAAVCKARGGVDVNRR